MADQNEKRTGGVRQLEDAVEEAVHQAAIRYVRPTAEELAAIANSFGKPGGPQVSPAVMAFYTSLCDETDRGCALAGAAYLDNALQDLLNAWFVDAPKIVEDLCEGNGGLATFSARIDIAYLVGLIGAAVRRDLHLVRKIRNDFAHTAETVSFEAQPVAARCREFAYAPILPGEEINPRRRFHRAIMGMAGYIDTAAAVAKHQPTAPDSDFDAAHADLRVISEEIDARFGTKA